MVIKDQLFNTPPWNTIIWRYMSFEKFLDVILEDHLFFTKVSNMTDKNECELPKKNGDILWAQSHELYNKKWFEFYALKRSTFINCWIINRFESYALWKIYLRGSKTGIAIKTNVKKLMSSINMCSNRTVERIFLGKVNYTDFIKDEVTISKLVTTKKNFYEFENEVRLVILKDPENQQDVNKKADMNDGIYINLDPAILIEEIYLSPFCGTYFKNIFEMILQKVNPILSSRIKLSEINDS